MELEQAFIDRTHFLDVQGGIVDTADGTRWALAIVGQAEKAFQKTSVRNETRVDIQGSEELAVQRSEREKRSELFVAEDGP